MNWNLWIRQFHRWVSIVFTAIVIAIFATLGMGKQPAQWVYYLPLAPLFVAPTVARLDAWLSEHA